MTRFLILNLIRSRYFIVGDGAGDGDIGDSIGDGAGDGVIIGDGVVVGDAVGAAVGVAIGSTVGETVGLIIGFVVGETVGVALTGKELSCVVAAAKIPVKRNIEVPAVSSVFLNILPFLILIPDRKTE